MRILRIMQKVRLWDAGMNTHRLAPWTCRSIRSYRLRRSRRNNQDSDALQPMPGKDLVAKWTAALGRPYVRGGNKVTALVDGPETFRAMYEAIQNTDRAGFIYLLAWWLDVDMPLLPEDNTATLESY